MRVSSAVENWHSIVRPHLVVHRSLSASLLALLAVWHNHRVAPWGVLSPLKRNGQIKEVKDWLVSLVYPPIPATEYSTVLKYEESLGA